MQIQVAKGQTNSQLLIKGFKIHNILYTCQVQSKIG